MRKMVQTAVAAVLVGGVFASVSPANAVVYCKTVGYPKGCVARKDQAPLVELTYNWEPEVYAGGRNFGHLAYRVDDIYATCAKLKDAGVTINRPPRDGHMAFIRTPDNISIELIQKGGSLPPAEPWASMANTGVW